MLLFCRGHLVVYGDLYPDGLDGVDGLEALERMSVAPQCPRPRNPLGEYELVPATGIAPAVAQVSG